MLKEKTKRDRLENMRSQLEIERSSFLTHWKTISDFLMPRRSRFSVTDVNKGERRNLNILDATATMSLRTLRSGMMSGITSPARPWFRLTTPDPDMAEYEPIKNWLYTNGLRMQTVFYRSNLYQALPVTYGDLGGFATAALLEEEDFTGDVVRFYPFPVGSYMISNNYKLKVDTFIRDFRMTVRQVVEKFGKNTLTGKIEWDNISAQVKRLYEECNYEAWIDICHVIYPNEEYDARSDQSKHKKYASCYYERGNSNQQTGNYLSARDEDKYLRESGYDYFPVHCPRWEVTGEDAYGTDCPGMTALGDIKELQSMQRRKSEAVEKMVRPPMQAPAALDGKGAYITPGSITYIPPITGDSSGYKPVYQFEPRVNELMIDIQDKRDLIRKIFFEDLFLMLANSDRRAITAREIDERHEEKLLALGPVLEQLNQDLLDPLIDVTFDIMVRQGLITEPPEELQGVPLKVEYISVMAQAQKMVGISGVREYAAFAGQVAQIDPSSLIKTNTDQLLDVYADFTSIPPGIVRSDEEVAAIREQQAQQAKAQQMAENLNTASSAAKNLSQADLEGENVLSRLMQNTGQRLPV